jgi:RNA polymerase sigma-70 factor (ECF subfamily)
MGTAPAPGTPDAKVDAAIREFCAWQYPRCGADKFGIGENGLAQILSDVVSRRDPIPGTDIPGFLASIKLEELVLARACAAGNDYAWEVFLTRYRATFYESAYKIAREESQARELADSLYAELYGVDAKGQQRTSKLLYYQGRGSLQGWLRTVIAQEYINRYRSTRRESSLDEAVDGGKQFPSDPPDIAVCDPRVEAAVGTELAALDAEERLLLASYFLDHRTLADIARMMRVHESTISRKLERITSGLHKRIRKQMMQAGMSAREADEAMQDVDVRDLRVNVKETLRQETPDGAFYKQKGERG